MNPIHVKILRDGARLPTYGTAGAAGADLYACIDAPVTSRPGETVFIPTGIALEVPEGCAGLVYARSGLACKRGLAPPTRSAWWTATTGGRLTWFCTTTAAFLRPSKTANASPSS